MTDYIEAFRTCIVSETNRHRSPGGPAEGAVAAFRTAVIGHRDRYLKKFETSDPIRLKLIDIADAAITRAQFDGLKVYLPEGTA